LAADESKLLDFMASLPIIPGPELLYLIFSRNLLLGNTQTCYIFPIFPTGVSQKVFLPLLGGIFEGGHFVITNHKTGQNHQNIKQKIERRNSQAVAQQQETITAGLTRNVSWQIAFN
jgi:hypothetical protein